MAITKNGQGVIVETAIDDKDRFDRTGVINDDSFAICDPSDPTKQIQFDAGAQSPEGTVIFRAGASSGNIILTLPTSSTTLGAGGAASNSFTVIQPDAGTSPTASSATDTLTITSSDASITVTGNSTTDTLDLVVANPPSSVISDTAYAASWNGVTGVAPSKNAVYDKIEALDAAKANTSHTHTASDVTDFNTAADARVAVHTGDTTDAHAASAITNTPSGNLAATTVQAALDELQTDVDGRQPLDSDLTAMAALSSTGIIARTGTGSASVRTITGTANRVTVTNGDGVSGNPTLDVGTDVVVLTGAQTLSGAKTHTQPILGEVDDGNSGAAHKSTLTGNVTYTFTAPAATGARLQLRIIQGAGPYTITWPASVKWPSATAPTISTANGAIDIISFFYDGTNYYGVASLAFG
jgi:hypothetical protein